MKTYGLDSYNQTISAEVSNPLRSKEGGDTKPMVLIVYGFEPGVAQRLDTEKRFYFDIRQAW